MFCEVKNRSISDPVPKVPRNASGSRFPKNFDMIFLKLSVYGFFWRITIIYAGNL